MNDEEDDLDEEFDEDEDDEEIICTGCGEGDSRNYVFDCARCGNEICPYCSDDHTHCRDCEMDAYGEEDEEEVEDDIDE